MAETIRAVTADTDSQISDMSVPVFRQTRRLTTEPTTGSRDIISQRQAINGLMHGH